MNVETRTRSWLLPAFSVLLAIVAWVAAVSYLAFAMGDVNAEDPIQEASLLAQHQLISQSSLVLFISSLIGSSWLGGNLFQSNRTASIAVLCIHLAATSGIFFVVLR